MSTKGKIVGCGSRFRFRVGYKKWLIIKEIFAKYRPNVMITIVSRGDNFAHTRRVLSVDSEKPYLEVSVCFIRALKGGEKYRVNGFNFFD